MANENNNLQDNEQLDNTDAMSETLTSKDVKNVETPVVKTPKAPVVKTPVKKIEPIAVPGGRVRGDVKSDFVKEQEDIERSKIESEKIEKAAVNDQKQKDQKAEQLQNEINKLQINIQYAQKNNLNSVAMETRIQELESEKSGLIPQVDQEGFKPFPVESLQDKQPEDTAEQLTAPIDSEVQQKVENIKNERTEIQAEQISLDDQIAEQKYIADQAMQKMREEDLELNKIDNGRFWKNTSTWQKIGLGIAMIFGGGAGGSNRAVDVVNNFINQDIEAQKLDNKSALAKREEAYRRVNKELSRLEMMTKDENKKAEIQVAKQKIAAETMKANQARLKEMQKGLEKQVIGKKLASADGISRDEFFALDKELKKTGIAFKDGRFRFASGAEAAKEVRQTIGDLNSAISGLNRLEEIGNESFLGGSLNILTDKKEAKLIQQQIIGKLRLELFGPGVLTDVEQRIARSIIGNPAKLMSISSAQVNMIKVLKSKLVHSMKDKVRLSGIKLPPTTNDINLAKIMKADAELKGIDLRKLEVNSNKWKILKKRAYESMNRSKLWEEEAGL